MCSSSCALANTGSDHRDLKIPLRALPLPDTITKHVKRLTFRHQIASRSNLRSILRLLPHLKRIEVDLGTQMRHWPEVEEYLQDRLGIDVGIAHITAGTDLQCEAPWTSPSGLNIFPIASEFEARAQNIIGELKEDVTVMAKQSIVAYEIHNCTHPCDCPATLLDRTVMDAVRIFLRDHWTTLTVTPRQLASTFVMVCSSRYDATPPSESKMARLHSH